MSPSRPRRAVARRAPLVAAAPAAGQGPQPRGRASSCTGRHQPWERGLMGNRKSAAWPSWSAEPSSQGPGEDKVKTTLLFVHCSFLEHHQPSRTSAPICPVLGNHPEPGQQLTAGCPHLLTLPLELEQESSEMEMEALKGPSAGEGRGWAGPCGAHPETPARGQSSDSLLPPHQVCRHTLSARSPGPPGDSQSAPTQGPEHTPSLPEPCSAWAAAPGVCIESHLPLSPETRISAHPSLHQ